MRIEDLDYDLPEELIAQRSAEPRDSSRLMVVDVESGGISHHTFRDLTEFLNPSEVVILNDTKVLPARLLTRKRTGGRVELLFLRDRGGLWEALARPGRRLRAGTELLTGKETLRVVKRLEGGRWLVEGEDVRGTLEREGRMPLPPYVEPTPEAEREYQTVYAEHAGSAAAPTAGFHFTERVLGEILDKGVRTARVTLHVGVGTFSPVKLNNVEEHRMHAEWYSVPEETENLIEEAGRVVAVGTTVARTLETFAQTGQREGESELFIYPGYRWQCVDTLLTNFHLPRSTLLAMVMSFGGEELVREAYQEAVRRRYRFYSFGDAMLLVGGGSRESGVGSREKYNSPPPEGE